MFYSELTKMNPVYDEKEKKLISFSQSFLKKNSSRNEFMTVDLRSINDCKFYDQIQHNFIKLASKTSKIK